VSPDPIRFAGGVNFYAYVGGTARVNLRETAGVCI
jgi:hypothetical protein